MFDTFFADLRFNAGMLRKNASFSAIAIATLALGIGANTAIFSIVDHIILRPLSYRESSRLFVIHEVVPKFASFAPLIPVSAMHFIEWRKNVRSFQELALIGGITLNLTGSGEPERLAAARVSPSLFPMLGIRPHLGRTFLDEEDHPGRDRVVIINDALWRRRFAADPNVIGRKIMLDAEPYEIVGVLPAAFHFPKLSQLFAMTLADERPQLWKPFALRDDERDALGDFDYACIARLRPGVSASEALAELNVVQSRISSQQPEKIDLRAVLVPLQNQITGRSRSGLRILLAAVGVVLLIGCVNIANLLLARGAARRREIAIRSALGASRGRLARQMLVESLSLSLIGGLFGVAIAYVGLRLILRYAPVDLPRMDEVRLDARVLLFTLAISILAGLLFGLLPAWRFAKADPQDSMKSGSRTTTAAHSSACLRSLLVGIEVGLSVICLIAGGLLLHSFVKLLHVDTGFETQRIVTVDLSLPDTRYPDLARRAAFVRTLIEQVEAVPSVTSASISNMLPLSGEGGNNVLLLDGAKTPIMERPLADIRQVNPGYFATMGIALLKGRVFEDRDRNRQVALVSALTAEHLWPRQNPIGKRFRMGADDSPLIEVTGIVGDVRGVSLSRSPSLTVYVPYWQRFYSGAALAVRTAMDPLAASSAIRSAIRRIDPQLPVPAFRTMEEIVAGSVAQRRFQMDLVLLFAFAAMLLASLGIYGVVSYSVSQRANEMGIRIALGAQSANIHRPVLRQALFPVAIGLAVGITASFALGQLLRSLLFGVSAADPISIFVVMVLLGAVATAASYLPARRATRADPLAAPKYE